MKMEALATKVVDKSSWQRGPWDGESDLENFKTASGLDASMARVSHSGSLCGYVGVGAAHPWFGKGYSEKVAPSAAQLAEPVDMEKVSVIALFLAAASGDDPAAGTPIDCLLRAHGGITYAGAGRPNFGEDPALWYFGFDCAHSGDLCPATAALYGAFAGDEYRDAEYVRSEVEALAAQLAKVAP